MLREGHVTDNGNQILDVRGLDCGDPGGIGGGVGPAAGGGWEWGVCEKGDGLFVGGGR